MPTKNSRDLFEPGFMAYQISSLRTIIQHLEKGIKDFRETPRRATTIGVTDSASRGNTLSINATVEEEDVLNKQIDILQKHHELASSTMHNASRLKDAIRSDTLPRSSVQTNVEYILLSQNHESIDTPSPAIIQAISDLDVRNADSRAESVSQMKEIVQIHQVYVETTQLISDLRQKIFESEANHQLEMAAIARKISSVKQTIFESTQTELGIHAETNNLVKKLSMMWEETRNEPKMVDDDISALDEIICICREFERETASRMEAFQNLRKRPLSD